jgi:putative thioredoxin
MVDVTDATFETDVLIRSDDTVVIVDLWAEWCGPCKALGPVLEKVVAETNGRAVLVKVDIDSNPGVAQMFRVQSIPAVFAIKDRKVVNSFLGAQPEAAVAQFVQGVLPPDEELAVAALIEAGDEASLLQALEIKPGHQDATVALAKVYATSGRPADALALLEKVPETMEARHVAALARSGDELPSDVGAEIEGLLSRVKDDEDARQRVLDLLELLGPEDERTAGFRRRLASALF